MQSFHSKVVQVLLTLFLISIILMETQCKSLPTELESLSDFSKTNEEKKSGQLAKISEDEKNQIHHSVTLDRVKRAVAKFFNEDIQKSRVSNTGCGVNQKPDPSKSGICVSIHEYTYDYDDIPLYSSYEGK